MLSMNVSNLIIGDVDVQVVRKHVKNLNLSIKPVTGLVRVSVPFHMSDKDLYKHLLPRLDWIRKKIALALTRQGTRQNLMVNGETHLVFGKVCRLEVFERSGRHEVLIKEPGKLILYVRPATTTPNREIVLNNFYRKQLKDKIPELLDTWQDTLGVEIYQWGVKRMKTRWGSCNIDKKRIWLNLELAKKEVDCLEYVIVHELAHLLERYHNKRFWGIVETVLPSWKQSRQKLRDERNV